MVFRFDTSQQLLFLLCSVSLRTNRMKAYAQNFWDVSNYSSWSSLLLCSLFADAISWLLKGNREGSLPSFVVFKGSFFATESVSPWIRFWSLKLRNWRGASNAHAWILWRDFMKKDEKNFSWFWWWSVKASTAMFTTLSLEGIRAYL